MRIIRLPVVPVLALMLVACSGDSTTDTTPVATMAGSTVTNPPPTTTPSSTTTTADPATTLPSSPASVREMRSELGLETITLVESTEGGPHPTLEWRPVAGATTYWIVVRDGSGEPYWAWSGSATGVRFGGGDTADLNQTAALHEAMTWSVLGFDDAGALIALSDVEALSP